MHITEDLARRFIAKVDIRGPNQCWEWTAGTVTGYGQLRIGDKLFLAHRIAWELFRGPIPPGLWILHTCDNRPCCNPGHLWPGTDADNATDRDAKGRQASKLTNDEVREIYGRYRAGGVSQPTLGRQYGVCGDQIGLIVRGVAWKHITADFRR